jgi:uncharacterized damage-inducible protein DinB
MSILFAKPSGIARVGLGRCLEPVPSFGLLDRIPPRTILVVSEKSRMRGAGFIADQDIPGAPPKGRPVKSKAVSLGDSILNAWSTNDRITAFLVENLPDALWDAAIPSSPRRTIRMVAAHMHNARCMWIKTLGQPHGIGVPSAVDRHRVSRSQLVRALKRSGIGIASLLDLGLKRDGEIPPTAAYVWRNLPLDVGHVLAYFVAHEGHHRGQILLAARQLDQRLPANVTNGLWQWNKRALETGR